MDKKGRKKGVKNLIKTPNGNLLNQHNVEFTIEDKKRLESLVNSANRKRKRMKEYEGNLFRTVDGKATDQKLSELHQMGVESDFILQPKSKSLQRFKSKDQFNAYISNLERVNHPDYIPMRLKLYKRNHLKAIENVFGKNDVYMKIRMMKPKDYMQTIAGDVDFLEIQYIYSQDEKEVKLEQLRSALNMKRK